MYIFVKIDTGEHGCPYSSDVLFNTAREVEEDTVTLKDVECVPCGISTTFAL